MKTTTFAVSATTQEWHFTLGIMLWFAWKQLPLQYQQQLPSLNCSFIGSCDLLENNYLCSISNNVIPNIITGIFVVICLKTTTFAVSATTVVAHRGVAVELWFAWKQLPLQYQQQLSHASSSTPLRCDLLENNYLCSISNNPINKSSHRHMLWFAWKQLPLQYQQQPQKKGTCIGAVVICLKTTTFAVSATTEGVHTILAYELWFAWKQLPLQYQQQRLIIIYY